MPTLVRTIAILDVAAFDTGRFLVTVLFFVAFGVAARALDRLMVGGFRMLRSE